MTDFHTASSLDGRPLPAAKVNAKGFQLSTSPKKYTYVTRRQYIEDAVYVVVVEGEAEFIEVLTDAVARPVYPLFLGRRSCVPSQPLIIGSPSGGMWSASAEALVAELPWQAGHAGKADKSLGAEVTVTATIDDPFGDDVVADVPVSFDPHRRGFQTRRVRHLWVTLPTGNEPTAGASSEHDPFEILGASPWHS